ncbi:MAG: hypothetical protein K0R10_2964 [Alphaproteobacteria bacterium]|jgi:hypothetical protein|nr:hypothetical protein [Alphaproteobacteria bacterium]
MANDKPTLSTIFSDVMSIGEAEAQARVDAAQLRQANTLLLGAIAANDDTMFDKAIRDGANVNADNGKPLEHAATVNNTLFLRKLLTRGADVSYAVAALEAEQKAIPRKERYDDYYERRTYTYKSKEAERRYKQINAIVKNLNEYEKFYLEKVAPIEAVRLQQQVLDNVAQLNRNVDEALHGKAVYKPKLKAPGDKP